MVAHQERRRRNNNRTGKKHSLILWIGPEIKSMLLHNEEEWLLQVAHRPTMDGSNNHAKEQVEVAGQVHNINIINTKRNKKLGGRWPISMLQHKDPEAGRTNRLQLTVPNEAKHNLQETHRLLKLLPLSHKVLLQAPGPQKSANPLRLLSNDYSSHGLQLCSLRHLRPQ